MIDKLNSELNTDIPGYFWISKGTIDTKKSYHKVKHINHYHFTKADNKKVFYLNFNNGCYDLEFIFSNSAINRRKYGGGSTLVYDETDINRFIENIKKKNNTKIQFKKRSDWF
ncbi:MAG: hypothetical protein Q9M91_08075 [Candidatus Dojkabacteria bacterium]|nr:hypothetical protein [Candidatus Dojkabacteria bacterium]MDQ7021737.1 hypothetical protein [Candidatus Dojkabacteria bacterium]